MTRGSSINFKKSSAGFEHNDRTEEREPKHLLPEEFRLENECDRSAPEARELLKEMVENAKEKYQERTGQKLQAKIFSVEAAINLEAHHTLKDVEKINEYLEQKHGLRAVQGSIHRDEGHINDEGKPEYNLHAHVVYCNLDKDGKTILKGLEKADLRELQTFVSEALQMTRGQSAEITKAKHKSPQEFRYEKTLATNKDLKAEIAQLREQLKERGATRSEYAELEQLNKELKEQIKAKDLTIDQLKERTDQGQSLGEKYDALPFKERMAMRQEMSAIVGESDGIELGSVKKRLELTEKDNESLKEQLREAVKVPHEPINARMINNLKSEVEMLQITNRVLEHEVTELKENRTAVDVSKEIEETHTKIVEMARIATSNAEAIEELEKAIPTDDPKKVAIAVYNSHIVADTGIIGKLGGEKKDTDLLIANMAKELQKRDNIAKRLLEQLKKEEITKMSISNVMKNVVESTKKHLESVFSKITGKSISEVQKERTELLNAQKERERSGRQQEDRGKGNER